MFIRIKENLKGNSLISLITKENLIRIVLGIAILVLIYIMYLFITRLGDIISPFIFAVIIAYLLNPLVKVLTKRKIPRIWAVIIVFLAFFLIIYLFIRIFVPIISKEIITLAQYVPDYMEDITQIVNQVIEQYRANIEVLPIEVKNVINNNIIYVQDRILYTLSSITGFTLGLVSRLIGIIIIPILTFYLLKDGPLIRNLLIRSIPKKSRGKIMSIARDVDIVFGGYVKGQLTVATFVGFMTGLGLMIIGVNFALIAGVISGITNIIPYFGPFIGAVPAALFALLGGGRKLVYTLIWIFIVQQIESGIIAPKVVGKSVGLHPVLVILALLVGGRLYGVIGLIIAVPMAAALKVLIKHSVSTFLKI